MRHKLPLPSVMLLYCLSIFGQGQLRTPGPSTGASNLPQDLEIKVAVAQQGTKLNDMDANINRRLDELAGSLKDVRADLKTLQTDMVKANTIGSMLTFGVSHVFTVLVTVLITFFLLRSLNFRWPEKKTTPPANPPASTPAT